MPMPVIEDQRQMLRRSLRDTLATKGDITSLWADTGVKRGFFRDGDVVDKLVADRRTLTAYVNQGRWVADCPACNGGIACWPEHAKGACLGCGRVFKIKFPSKAKIAEAEKVLSRRPVVNRNWRGETIGQLRDDNARRGV